MDSSTIAVILIAVAALFLLKNLIRLLGDGIGSLPVTSRPLMTKRERIVCHWIELAVPGVHVHAQVSMGAILQPRWGLDRSRSTTVRNRFSSKRVDVLLEDRTTGEILAIVELDDRSHNSSADAQRDRMTRTAGYQTIRLSAGRHDAATVRNAIHSALALPNPRAARHNIAA